MHCLNLSYFSLTAQSLILLPHLLLPLFLQSDGSLSQLMALNRSFPAPQEVRQLECSLWQILHLRLCSGKRGGFYKSVKYLSHIHSFIHSITHSCTVWCVCACACVFLTVDDRQSSTLQFLWKSEGFQVGHSGVFTVWRCSQKFRLDKRHCSRVTLTHTHTPHHKTTAPSTLIKSLKKFVTPFGVEKSIRYVLFTLTNHRRLI